MSETVAVVVHHRNYDKVGRVVKAILDQGIAPQNLVVVDNSEEPAKRATLREVIEPKVQLVYTANRGYGAAVNHGVQYFKSRLETPRFFLVSTHEALPTAGAVAALKMALQAQPTAAVAGPTLVSGTSEEYVWSTGGYLHRVTGIPGHYDHRESLAVLNGYTAPVLREWLDGAFLLYRWDDIVRDKVPEHYFLYMEETDLHVRLRKRGREVVWVPAARVWQDSNGIPAFYFSRNLRLFLRDHGGYARATLVPPLAVARRLAADAARGRGLKAAKDYCKGLLVRLPKIELAREEFSSRVHIINPLGAALRHYQDEMMSVLSAPDVTITARQFREPSASGKRAHSWVSTYISALIAARGTRRTSPQPRLLVLWPVMGYLDLVVLGLLGFKDASIVLHDPHPLVRSIGYSKFAKRLASVFGKSVQVIAHSQKAYEVIHEEVPRINVQVLPHPMLEPVPATVTPGSARPLVRVLGQYKADRDIQALIELGREFSGLAELEVHGRGWPAIQGWKVSEGFVSESRLDHLIKESAVVLIPYKKFFQSGIAIRALECGTAFVGPKKSVLAEMLGHESPLLVDSDSASAWSRAVRRAIENGSQEATRAAEIWRANNVSCWSRWLTPAP